MQLILASLPHASTVLQLTHEADVAVWTRLAGDRLHSMTGELDGAVRREENRLAWRSRAAEPELRAVAGERRYLATRRVELGEVRCQVGLPENYLKKFEIHLVVDGHLLCKRSVPGAVAGVVGGVEAVVEGALGPNERFDDVQPDDALAQGLEAVLRGLRGTYDRLALDWVNVRRSGPSHESKARNKLCARLLPREDELRTRMTEYLDLVYGDDFVGDYFAAFYLARQTLSDQLRDEPWRWRPVLEAEPGEVNETGAPYDRLPLFATVGGDWLSLVALRHWCQESDELRWVSQSEHRDAECEAPILWLSAPAHRVLVAVFGAHRLREDPVGYRIAREEAKFLRKRVVPMEVDRHTRGQFVVRFRIGGAAGAMQGELGMRNRLIEPVGQWEVRLLRKQRPLATRRLRMCLPSGRGVVNADGLEPNLLWDDVAEGAGLNEVWGGLWRAAQQLLLRLATTLETLPEESRKDARDLICSGLCAWFPPEMAGVLVALRSRSGDDDQWVALYEELLGPLAVVSPDTLAPILRAALTDPKELPEPSLVFVQLPEGTWPLEGAGAPLELDFFQWDPASERSVPVGGDSLGVEPGDERVLRSLLEAPIFEANDGSHVSPWELLGLCAAGEPIHFVHSYWSEQGETDERVLIVTGPQLELLRTLVGTEGVRHGGALLKEASRRKSFLAREVLKDLRLGPDEALVQCALNTHNIQGQVGLALDPEAGSWIDLHQEQRFICRNTGFTKPGLVATVNDDRLTVKRDYTYIDKDDRLKYVYRCCQGMRGALYERLVEQWDGLDVSARRSHGPWLLAQFAESLGESFAQGEPPQNAILARVTQLRLLEGAGGVWHSLEDLRRVLGQTGRVDFLASAREGELLDPSQVVVLVNRKITLALQRIFGTLRDYAPRWDDDQVLVAFRRHGARPLPPEAPEAGLVRAQFRLSPWEGAIYLPEDPATELVIRFGVKGVEAICWRPSLVFPCAGRFDTDGVRMYRRRQRGALTDAQERIVERQACSLYQSLVTRFQSGKWSAEEREAARMYLRYAVQRLHWLIQEDADGQLNRYWRNLYHRIEVLPLYPLDTGELVSLRAALEPRPPDLAAYGLWEKSEGTAPQGLIIGRTRVVPFALEEVEAEGAPVDDLVEVALDEPVDDLVEDALDEPVDDLVAVRDLEQVERLSAEERLVAGLRAELLELHTQENRLLDHVLLLSIRLSPDPSACAVTCDESGITLFRGHPVVEALRTDLGDPHPRRSVLLAMVALGVYTAVNLHLEEITDDHEALFQHLLVQRLRSRIFDEG